MLDEGLKLGCEHLGIDSRTVCYVERESYAAAALVARMEDKALAPAPIWDDLTTFDGGEWRGKVDCIAAGFPCQPWSAAGRQQGTDDDRWLWPAIKDIIRDAEPRLVWLENVPGLVSGGGLHHVLDDLAEIGFHAEWLHITARAVGASHRRERFFLLAYSRLQPFNLQQWREGSELTGSIGDLGNSPGIGRDKGRARANGKGQDPQTRPEQEPTIRHQGMADAIPAGSHVAVSGGPDGTGAVVAGTSDRMGHAGGTRENEQPEGSGPRGAVGESDGSVGDAQEQQAGRLPIGEGAAQSGLGCGSGNVGNARSERSEGPRQAEQNGRREFAATGVFAPGPSSTEWGRILETSSHLAPAIEPGLRVLVDGMALVVDASRADQLRCAGNGVVALQAAVAFVELVRRIRND